MYPHRLEIVSLTQCTVKICLNCCNFINCWENNPYTPYSQYTPYIPYTTYSPYTPYTPYSNNYTVYIDLLLVIFQKKQHLSSQSGYYIALLATDNLRSKLSVAVRQQGATSHWFVIAIALPNFLLFAKIHLLLKYRKRIQVFCIDGLTVFQSAVYCAS